MIAIKKNGHYMIYGEDKEDAGGIYGFMTQEGNNFRISLIHNLVQKKSRIRQFFTNLFDRHRNLPF